jgi:hypothetical protein
MESGGEERQPTWWRRREVRWTITVFVLVVVVEYLVVPEFAGAKQSVNALRHVNLAVIVLAVGLEAAALVAYAWLTHAVLPSGGPRRRRLFRINLSSLAVSHVMPGGSAPGAGLAYRLLTESNVSSADAAFALATQGVGSAVVLNGILWLALVVSIPFHGYNALYGVSAAAGAVLLAIFAAFVFLLTKGRRHAIESVRSVASHLPFLNEEAVALVVQRIADRLRTLLDNPRVLVHAVIWAGANWLLDAASLWVFLAAFGKVVSPINLLVAYGLANVLAVVPITPSGLGVVEGVLLTTLVGFGVGKGIAIDGVLAWRLVNFWLPIPAGGLAYLSLRFGKPYSLEVSTP